MFYDDVSLKGEKLHINFRITPCGILRRISSLHLNQLT